MQIKNRISQHRRDFVAEFQCEACKHLLVASGYDDAYFHAEVIPAMRCPVCGAVSPGQSSFPIVPAGVVI